MSKRNYNVFFNTHTVSGIVISVALYVIFFAGAFALFKDEITAWEEGKHSQNIAREHIDFDGLIQKLSKDYYLESRDFRFILGDKSDEIFVLINPAKDTINAPKEARSSAYFSLNINTGKTKTYQEKYSLGEFLYRLHFFSQIPSIGVYLAGFVAFFFLFAIVTGTIVHWKKIVSNFYQFNPKITLKRVWTDAHTALGVIGLPFQFIYAVSGAYFCLSILVLLPANTLYNGDQNKLMNDILPERNIQEWVVKTEKSIPSMNAFIEDSKNSWDDFHINEFWVKNYSGVNMKYLLAGELEDDKRFLGQGYIEFDTETKTKTILKNPNKTHYVKDIQLSMGRLHFANFGGIWVKVIYFILALITCFVIITGVLIWIEARNKKSRTLKQRLYSTKVGHIYMAICLSLFPVIALFFLVIKLLPEAYDTQKMGILYNGFFIVWLVAVIYFRFKRNNYFTNKTTLLIGTILGFLIPIANGIVSNNWIWNTYRANQFDILLVDLLWICLSAIALFIFYKIKPSVQTQSAFKKHPIDYKNIKQLKLEDSQKK